MAVVSHQDLSYELEVLDVDFDFVARGKLLWGLAAVFWLDAFQPFCVPFWVCGEVEELITCQLVSVNS